MCQFVSTFRIVAALVVIFIHVPCRALESREILVLANERVPAGVELARRYMAQRNIPETHLVTLSLPEEDICSRNNFDDRVVPVVRKALSDMGNDPPIRCLVAMYGLPLKVASPETTPEERQVLDELRQRREALIAGLKPLNENDPEHQRVLRKIENIGRRIATLDKKDRRAAFDSELALVRKENYPLPGWIPNPYCIGFLGKNLPVRQEAVLMISRLDGPTPETVARIISDSVRVEKEGLAGIAYFDARWPRGDGTEELTGYARCDDAIHEAADTVRRSRVMPVVLNTVERLFQPGECPNAALYCGWYSLAKYIDAFAWQPGAVGYHIASSECDTLRRKNSRVWCKMMLEKGVAAAIGPVHEPYVQGFPLPDLFFGTLLQGRLTLVECYFLSLPYLSWQMVLIGDPLYTPFRKAAEPGFTGLTD